MSVSTYQSRTHWQVTWSVWQALFVREFLTRLAADRLAWFWMLLEPIAIISIMVGIRAFVLGTHSFINGASFITWTLLGLLGYFMFRENMMRSVGAIDASIKLFTYRQVRPIDPVLVRCFLEGMLKSFVLFLFVVVGMLLDLDLFPDHFYSAVFIWISLWMLGVGTGLALGAASRLIPEIGIIARITTLPLLLISGALLPLHMLPEEILKFLMLNPLVHGLELLRAAFVASYRPLHGVSLAYFWFWILGMMLFGLMLHLRFKRQLQAE